MFLPPDDVPTFGRKRNRSIHLSRSDDQRTGGFVSQFLKRSLKAVLVGMVFKIILPFAVLALMALAVANWQQIAGLFIPEQIDGQAMVDWVWGLVEKQVTG